MQKSIRIIFFLFCVSSVVWSQSFFQESFVEPTPPMFTVGSSDSSLHTFQQSTQLETPPRWKDPFISMPGTWAAYYKKEFQTDRIPYYLGIGALTAALIVTDHDTWKPVRKLFDDNYTFRKFCDYSEYMGQGWFQFGIAGVFVIHGYAYNDSKSLWTASQTVEVILTTGAVIQLLKHITGRETPATATTLTGKWQWFPNQIDYHKNFPKYDAFPTGHLATGMATLTVMMENYPEQKWIPYIGYPAIAFIGIGMVGQNIHWWSDYPLGIAIGYSFAKIVAARHREKIDNGELRSSNYLPTTSITLLQDGVPAFSLSWKW